MKIVIKNINDSAVNFIRKAGYRFIRHDGNQISFERRVGSGIFPRFHIYVSEKEGSLYINLHIDQKKQSYDGTNMHSGEYDGDLIEEEAGRLKSIANS